MADYRTGIRQCIMAYAGNQEFLVKAINDLINTAIENEGARLLAEVEAKLKYPVCPQCSLALEQEKLLVEAARGGGAAKSENT